MSMQDPIADLRTRIRNAQAARHPRVALASSKLKAALCAVLRDEGYIEGFAVSESAKPSLTIELRYPDDQPAIEALQRVSRPGLRVYRQSKALGEVRGGLGIAIVSTAQGLMTDRAARRAGLGGEVLCTVF